MLPAPLDAPAAAAAPSLAADGGETRPLWMVEKEAIERAIAQAGGNIPRAAARLEVSPSTIYRKRLAWDPDHTA